MNITYLIILFCISVFTTSDQNTLCSSCICSSPWIFCRNPPPITPGVCSIPEQYSILVVVSDSICMEISFNMACPFKISCRVQRNWIRKLEISGAFKRLEGSEFTEEVDNNPENPEENTTTEKSEAKNKTENSTRANDEFPDFDPRGMRQTVRLGKVMAVVFVAGISLISIVVITLRCLIRRRRRCENDTIEFNEYVTFERALEIAQQVSPEDFPRNYETQTGPSTSGTCAKNDSSANKGDQMRSMIKTRGLMGQHLNRSGFSGSDNQPLTSAASVNRYDLTTNSGVQTRSMVKRSMSEHQITRMPFSVFGKQKKAASEPPSGFRLLTPIPEVFKKNKDSGSSSTSSSEDSLWNTNDLENALTHRKSGKKME